MSGREEKAIAHVAYLDPEWVDAPPPRKYEKKANIDKTLTGEAIAIRVKDMRLRRALTESTHMPRLTRNTNPKAIDAAEEADFEEEINAYKRGEFSAPSWFRQAIKQGSHMKEVKPEHKVAMPSDKKRRLMPKGTHISGASSSNSSYRPLTDSQALGLSDMLLSTQDAEQYWQDEEGGDATYDEPAHMEPERNEYEQQDGVDTPGPRRANATPHR